MANPIIAIVGSADEGRQQSGEYDPPLGDPAVAKRAARELGRELALANMRIAVYESDPSYIEAFVVEGYLGSGRAAPNSIDVHYPHDRSDPPDFQPAEEHRSCFRPVPSPEDRWEVSFYRSIRSVDGLLLIGGANSTLVSGLMAIPDARPILTLDASGGSARRIWRLLTPTNHLLTEEDHRLMGLPWKAGNAKRFVECLERQIERRAERSRTPERKPEVPRDRPDGLRIAWMSDIHVADDGDETPGIIQDYLRGLFHLRGNRLTEHFPRRNLQRILQKLEELRPDHILVTGDITNFAQANQFRAAVDLFASSQKAIKDRTALGPLDPQLWTVIPGNHDVTAESPADGRERRNLGMFFRHFRALYEGAGPNYDGTFPFQKVLPKKSDNGLAVRLICLDSNVRHPVSRVGVNARGRIGDAQRKRLREQLSNTTDDSLVLVLLHHHPLVVPHVVSRTEEYFLSLDDFDGRDLVKLCSANGVSAILHGHFHHLSVWGCSLPDTGRQMSIIGCPSGTMDTPDVGVEFLELREAARETIRGVRPGLSLYRWIYSKENWTDEFVAFIE